MHEVDCAESAEILVNSKIVSVSDIKFDGKEAVLIELETVDGQRIYMIKQMNHCFALVGKRCKRWRN